MDNRKTYEAREIKQIMPADGWHALFVLMGEDGRYALESEPLVCWAYAREIMRYVDTDADVRGAIPVDTVVGMYVTSDGYTDCPESDRNFVGYRHISQPQGRWQWAVDEYDAKHQEANA